MLLKDGLCLNRFYCCNGGKIFSRVGIHHSEETRKKQSMALKGITRSEETRKKMSLAKKGTPRSEETRQKMSEARKGQPTRKGQPAWNKGRPSPFKGIPRSEETRKKISIANKRRIKISDTIFNSLTEASKYYNAGISTISYWIKTKKHGAVYIEK